MLHGLDKCGGNLHPADGRGTGRGDGGAGGDEREDKREGKRRGEGGERDKEGEKRKGGCNMTQPLVETDCLTHHPGLNEALET